MDPTMRKDGKPATLQPSPKESFFISFNNYFSVARLTFLLLFASAIIHRYDPRSLNSSTPSPRSIEQTLLNYEPFLGPWFDQPSTSVFLSICVVYATLFAYFMYKHKNDTYQSYFVVGALFLAQGVDAIYTGLYTTGDVYVLYLKSFVPAALVAGVVVSAGVHGVGRWIKGESVEIGETVGSENEKSVSM